MIILSVILAVTVYLTNTLGVLITLNVTDYDSKKDFLLCLVIPFRKGIIYLIQEYKDLGE